MNRSFPIRSEIRQLGGVPTLFVNGEPFAAAAYMTYLEKCNAYADFTAAGYRLFSVPVLFSGRWISVTDGFVPFKKGMFDEKGKPDFTPFDEAVQRILDACPDAYIFPRVNMSLPVWWENEHPDDVNLRADGTSARESFYSETWRKDAEEMLRQFIRYVNASPYASHIVGYHLAGGNTEEWFHFDMNGGYGKNAEPAFEKFLTNHYPDLAFHGLPDLNALHKDGRFLNDAYLTAFLEFASAAVAGAITRFAAAAKEETDNTLIAGVFYGYSLEVPSPLHGVHALKILLNDKNIDFICSPNSYFGVRAPDVDWTEMYPADSVRLHGKTCFQESDIRTHLTVPLPEKDPATDPNGILSAQIWQGLKTKEQARAMIKKSFARQLIKGNAFWWFDMWGGWYADEDIMSDLKAYRRIYEKSLADARRASVAGMGVFVDEAAFGYMTECSLRNAAFEQRKALGYMGAPYDIYDVSDFPAVYAKYKAILFLSCAPTEYYEEALRICREKNVPYLTVSEEKEAFSAEELRDFLQTNGVHIYCESGDILYANENFFALYAVSDGEKTVRLPETRRITELFTDNDPFFSDTVNIVMNKGEIKIYRMER